VESLFAPFGPVGDLPEYDFVSPDAIPQPYHDLLVHNHHMTVTVESHHGDLVDVRILARVLDGDFYTRKILLKLQGSGRVVQFGAVRVHLNYCSDAVLARSCGAGGRGLVRPCPTGADLRPPRGHPL
jgi:hypothetical protein